ncbi:unnamed protein product [Brassica rapa subsp. trilocularis]
MCKSTKIEMLPFPQDKIISVVHTDSSGNRDTSVKKISCTSRNLNLWIQEIFIRL